MQDACDTYTTVGCASVWTTKVCGCVGLLWKCGTGRSEIEWVGRCLWTCGLHRVLVCGRAILNEGVDGSLDHIVSQWACSACALSSNGSSGATLLRLCSFSFFGEVVGLTSDGCEKTSAIGLSTYFVSVPAT